MTRTLHNLRRQIGVFQEDEQGGATIWALFWLVVLVGMGGIAVDITNANRVETVMQATADAVVHDAVLDLPDETAATDRALAVAALHMRPEEYGAVLVADDVEFGMWDRADRTFSAPAVGEVPNSARATLRLTDSRENALGTLMLKVAGFDAWEIAVSSTVLLDWERCYLDGLISAQKVIMDSSNVYTDNFCVYGRNGIQLVNGNDFRGQFNHAYAGYGTGVTHECGFFLMGVKGAPPDCNMDTNPGLEEGRFISDDVYPERIIEIGADGKPVLDANGNWIVTLPQQLQDLVTIAQATKFYTDVQWRSGSSANPNGTVVSEMKKGGYFFLQCAKDSDRLELVNGNYSNLTLVTNCLLELPGSSSQNPNVYENVTFASVSTASFKDSGIWRTLNHNIAVRGGNTLGTSCEGKGTKFFTMTGVKFDGGVIHKGNEVNAGSTVGIDGSNDAASTVVHSLSVHSMGNIVMTSSNLYGLCNRGGSFANVIPLPVLVN